MRIIINGCVISECEGGDHKWEFERPTLRELKRIQDLIGMNIEEFETGMNAMLSGDLTSKGIDMLLALVDLLHRRDGLRVPYDDIDVDFPTMDFEFDDHELPDEPSEQGDEGKDLAPTKGSQSPVGEAEPPASGRVSKAASKPKSSRTPRTSGGTSA